VGSRRYIRKEDFDAVGIVLEWQAFEHPTYSQLHGTFTPNLSILDLLMNEGPVSREVLLGGTHAD
jgi:hypothetical protein